MLGLQELLRLGEPLAEGELVTLGVLEIDDMAVVVFVKVVEPVIVEDELSESLAVELSESLAVELILEVPLSVAGCV